MDNLTWDYIVTLIGNDGYTEDELRQQKAVEKKTDVFCCKKPISRQEHYMAGQNNLKVCELLIVHPYEYSGENEVVFEGKRLHIEKTYPINQEELELTCTERIGDRN